MIYTQNLCETWEVKEAPSKIILTAYVCLWQGGQWIQFNFNYSFKIWHIEMDIFRERIQQLCIKTWIVLERQRIEILNSPEIQSYWNLLKGQSSIVQGLETKKPLILASLCIRKWVRSVVWSVHVTSGPGVSVCLTTPMQAKTWANLKSYKFENPKLSIIIQRRGAMQEPSSSKLEEWQHSRQAAADLKLR